MNTQYANKNNNYRFVPPPHCAIISKLLRQKIMETTKAIVASFPKPVVLWQMLMKYIDFNFSYILLIVYIYIYIYIYI